MPAPWPGSGPYIVLPHLWRLLGHGYGFFPPDRELRVRQNLCEIGQVRGGPLRMKEENSSEDGEGCEDWKGTEQPVVLIISFLHNPREG